MATYIKSSSIISPLEILNDGNFANPNFAAEKHLKCLEPDYKTLINPRRLRRMSRMLKMGLFTAKKALSNAQIEMPNAIITGTGMGCMQDTEKFLSALYENEEGILSPTPFIQSTHNTVSSLIALFLKCYGYNFTYVHRGFSFESALLDGMLFCEENENPSVLIGGIDEIIEPYFDITNRMKLWEGEDVLAGEGSAFFVLSDDSEKAFGKVLGVKTIFSPNASNNQNLASEIQDFLSENELRIQDLDLVCLGQNGSPLTQSTYDFLIESIFSKNNLIHFKHFCGEYKTASAFGFWLGSEILKNQSVPNSAKLNNFEIKNVHNILIYNNYQNINHSLILLQNA